MASIIIRPAGPADAPAVRNIYRPFVENSAVTFEVELPSVADFEERISPEVKLYPFLVAEEEGGPILGYSYAGRQMDRAAYQWNATLSVYLGNCRRQGLGTALYLALMDILKLQNIHNVYGGVTWPNPASEALHLKLGFSLLGRYRLTGFKAGLWHDVVWFEKRLLGEEDVSGELAPLPPSPLIFFKDLEPDKVASSLGRYRLKMQ